MKIIMTGLDHKRSGIEVREQFALTKEKTQRVLSALKDGGRIGGCVILSTCNRTELYVSASDGNFAPTKALLTALGKDFGTFERYFTERNGDEAIRHLCRVAAGLDSLILGDDQIITQAREALELSRETRSADSTLETMFKLAIQAAKAIKTDILRAPMGVSSVPGRAVESIRAILPPANNTALVIGNGRMGRLVSERLIAEGANVVVTLRQYKKGVVQVPSRANTVNYSERYKAVEYADIVVSATLSPHYTLCYDELRALSHLPRLIVDLAVPRDVEPAVSALVPTLLTIDDISDEGGALPAISAARIDETIAAAIEKYHHWRAYKEMKHRADSSAGGTA